MYPGPAPVPAPGQTAVSRVIRGMYDRLNGDWTVDEMAAAASLVMGQAAQGCPVVLVRGAGLAPADCGSAGLLRERALDMFR